MALEALLMLVGVGLVLVLFGGWRTDEIRRLRARSRFPKSP